MVGCWYGDTGRNGDWLSSDWPAKVFDLAPLTDEQVDALIHALDPTVTRRRVRSRAGALRRCPVLHRAGGERTRSDRVLTTTARRCRIRCTSRCSRACSRDRTWFLWWRRRRSSGGRSIVGCWSRFPTWTKTTSTMSSTSSKTHWCSNHRAPAVGVSVTSCYERWRLNSHRRAYDGSLHGKVADALLGGAAGDPDWRLVASHYDKAERFMDAASAYREASAVARLRGAFTEARNYLTQCDIATREESSQRRTGPA